MKLPRLPFVLALSALLTVGLPELRATAMHPLHGDEDGQEDEQGEGDDSCGPDGQGEDEDEGEGDECEDGEEQEGQEAQVDLVRPDPAPDADATGTLRIRSEDDEERFDVRVENVDVTLVHELFIEDPADSGAFSLVAPLTAKCDTLKLRLDTEHGDALPLGVALVADLAGRDVEIRSGGVAILTGTVPAFVPPVATAKAKAKFKASPGAPAPHMVGKLMLRSKVAKGQQTIDFKAKHVPWDGGAVHVFIESAPGSNTFQDAGELVRKGASANGKYRRDTKHGDALPLGITTLSKLAGRALELRDASNNLVYLRGVIPAVK